jgi:hypothetical protein
VVLFNIGEVLFCGMFVVYGKEKIEKVAFEKFADNKEVHDNFAIAASELPQLSVGRKVAPCRNVLARLKCPH